jgi:N-carbamoylputrescine amidase
MDHFKIASVQMNALKDDLDHNLDRHVHFIAKAARAGCRLVLFPELSVTAHYGDEKVVQFAEETGRGRIFETIHGEARKQSITVSYGFCELAQGTHYNSQALVGPDGLIGVQHKVHASGDEYFSFRMGRSLEVFDLGFCRVGTLICYDSAFSEAWRVLALKGAEVILLPHAGRSGPGKRITRAKQIESLRRRLKGLPGDNGVYAKSNGVFAVYANQAGFNGHSTHQGGAYMLDPSGEVLNTSRASLDDQIIMAELDPELARRARRLTNFVLKKRRPEVYRELTEMI